MTIHLLPFVRMHRLAAIVLAVLTLAGPLHAEGWWNKEWTARKKFTLDTSTIPDPIGTAAVLVRLHDGNHQFLAGKDDGSDLRFIAADEKTPLAHHVERFDSLLNEAFVWVKVPDLKPGTPATFWLYYGNTTGQAARTDDPKGTYDEDTVLVYHFAENNAAPADSSAGGNKAEAAGTGVVGSLIGGGLRFSGQNSVTIPASASLAWTEGAPLTWSAWIKPTALAANSVLFSRRENGNALLIGEDNGVPFVEVTNAAGTQRSAGGAPLEVGKWRHLAVVSAAGKLTLYLDGESYATLDAALPALNSPITLGKDSSAAAPGFTGEVDELQIAKVARPIGFLKLAAISQSGSDNAAKVLTAGADENSGGGHSAMLEHVMLFGDIAKNMMFDGWIAVGVCVLMIAFGWTVAVRKFNYLNSIQKGTEAFLKQWAQVSSDLTALDHSDEQSVKHLGGNIDAKTLRHLHRSPLYHLYHIGSEEIRHRVGSDKDRSKGLSARSIQAIRASLESGLVRENQRMNKGLIFLTISIAGGPYVGLLGTVVGVMITFAIIAKSGEVDVNSIAPGIASALLATVAGLIVAIPALFIYSYLSSRIKDLLAAMQVFIDEFIAKMAEFYPTPGDVAAAHGPREVAMQSRPTESKHPSETISTNHAS
jgi:biopolymer transport protein ExbB